MTEKELKNRLKELKTVKPNQNWVIFCRENLAREMGDFGAQKTSVFGGFSVAVIRAIRGMGEIRFLKPAAILAGVFVFLFGSGLFSVSRAKASLPGDRLYPVKIALEQARLLVTPSQEGKTRIQSEIIVSRLAELEKVVNAGEPLASKQPKIEEAVSNLQKQLLTVKDELPKIENMEPKKVMEMAKNIDANAVSAQQALSNAKIALSPEMKRNLSEKIAEVADEADKTSNKALEVMIRKQDEGNEDTHGQILAKLGEKIKKTEGVRKSLEIVAKSAVGKEFSTNAAIILDETDKAIEQAKLSLQKDDMGGALQTIKAADELMKSAQKIAEASGVSDSDKNSDTSTSVSDKTTADKTVSDMPIDTNAATSTPAKE